MINVCFGQTEITLDPSVHHQTISGWEYEDGLEGGPHSPTYPVFISRFNQYKDSLYDHAANDLGVNRIRFLFGAGIEGPDDGLWGKYLAGQISFEATYKHPIDVVSSGRNPDVVDLKGFQFAAVDFQINNMVLPMKQRVEANGERFYFTGTYNAFRTHSGYLHSDPAYYARFVLAVFKHMDQTFGFVPDTWEMCNEPENAPAWSDGTLMGPALVKTAAVLHANGYNPKFELPSPAFVKDAIRYFRQVIAVRGALPLIAEFSYHMYDKYADAYGQEIQQIAALGVQYGFDTAMNEAASIANGSWLHDGLKKGNNSSWEQYALAQISYAPNNDGYYAVDAKNNIKLQTNAINYRQYFHYIRPGAVRIDAKTNNARSDPVAFINTNGKYVVVVQAATEDTITVSNLPAGTYGITDSLGGKHPDSNVTNGTLTTQISGRGYITIYGKTM
ncbi:MAG: hypothetical protein LAN37_00490 [Acidobacteriia bacterium]|nr:hypothetical protein [Terriglobia bacterium]